MKEERSPAGATSASRGWSRGRRTLLYAAVGYLLFAVYGSLVPLDLRPMPLADALEEFRNIRYLSLGIASRADWVANVLLFLPLAFLWLGVAWVDRRVRPNVVATLLVVLACVVLCVCIEFTQLFFPPRTVSLNDVLAEVLGAGIGIGLWWLAGTSVVSWLSGLLEARGKNSLARRGLYLYLFLFFAYNLLPLDLTLSPVEIYHKWREGRVVLIPFGFTFDDPAQALYGLVTDIVLWIPVGLLWGWASFRSRLRVWGYVLLAACLLEFLQLFVFTRVSDLTDIVTAALGGAAGVGGTTLRPRRTEALAAPPRRDSQLRFRLFVWVLLLVGQLFVIALVFWYPFQFELDRNLVREGVTALNKVPFQAYYYGTEFRAATQLLRKSLFFLPLGVLLAFPVLRIRAGKWRRMAGVGAILGVAAVAFGVEVGQVLLPEKNPDTTDWLLETLGGAAGYLLVVNVERMLHRPAEGED